ncbi:MAG: hypothetical protein AAB873_00075, partial [Patescibacteria group bacterium]
MQIDEGQLKKVLLYSKLISREDLETLSEKAKSKNQKLGNLLLSEGKISEVDLARMEAFVLGIPFINLADKKIEPAVLSLIPEPIARNHNIIAYEKSKLGLEVAMLDVDDLPIIDFIKKGSGTKILPRLTDSVSIKYALTQYRKSLQADFDNIIKKEAATLKASTNKESKETE